jgi:hypothetical protein
MIHEGSEIICKCIQPQLLSISHRCPPVGPEIKRCNAQLLEACMLSVDTRSTLVNRLEKTKRLEMTASDSMLKQERFRSRPSGSVVKLQTI